MDRKKSAVEVGAGREIQSGRKPPSTDGTSERAVYINSCGYDVINAGDRIPETYRKNGRLDYQLIYIEEGEGVFYIDGTPETLKQGSLILFRPGVTQRYIYRGDERTVAYYIHFTGTEAEKLLEETGFSGQQVWQTEKKDIFPEAVQKIMHELKIREENHELMCDALFRRLLVRLRRSILSGETFSAGTENELAKSIADIRAHSYQPLRIREYAEQCGISVSWFMRRFSAETGCTPREYQEKIRMARAEDLLMTTDLSISEVSYAIGYEDPLYFSRVFRKRFGKSPSGYRKDRKRKE